MAFELVSEFFFVFALLFGLLSLGFKSSGPCIIGTTGTFFYFWDQPIPNHRWSLFLIICWELRPSPRVRTRVPCAFYWGWGFVLFLWGLTGPRSAVGNVSGYRCVSDCRSRGREFDPGPVPYFRGD